MFLADNRRLAVWNTSEGVQSKALFYCPAHLHVHIPQIIQVNLLVFKRLVKQMLGHSGKSNCSLGVGFQLV